MTAKEGPRISPLRWLEAMLALQGTQAISTLRRTKTLPTSDDRLTVLQKLKTGLTITAVGTSKEDTWTF